MEQMKANAEHTGVSIEELVCTTLAQACGCDRGEISKDIHMLDLGVDSLTLVSVLAQVEAVYDIDLEPDDTVSMMEAERVSDLIDRLAAIVGRAQQGAPK